MNDRSEQEVEKNDVAATLYQFGFSTSQVRTLLSSRHMTNEAGVPIRQAFNAWVATAGPTD